MKFLSIIFSVLSLSQLCSQTYEYPPYYPHVLKMQDKFFKIVHQKYGLASFGVGGNLQGNVKALALDFRYCGPSILSKEELRRLLVELTESYLQEINSNSELIPYLDVYPFTPENISIEIDLYTIEDKRFIYPNYTIAISDYGKIKFFSDDEQTPIGSHRIEEKETYEEALKKINDGS